MTEIPEITVTVKRGEWTCGRCGGQLGAAWISGAWQLNIPTECVRRRKCELGMLGILELQEGSNA